MHAPPSPAPVLVPAGRRSNAPSLPLARPAAAAHRCASAALPATRDGRASCVEQPVTFELKTGRMRRLPPTVLYTLPKLTPLSSHFFLRHCSAQERARASVPLAFRHTVPHCLHTVPPLQNFAPTHSSCVCGASLTAPLTLRTAPRYYFSLLQFSLLPGAAYGL